MNNHSGTPLEASDACNLTPVDIDHIGTSLQKVKLKDFFEAKSFTALPVHSFCPDNEREAKPPYISLR